MSQWLQTQGKPLEAETLCRQALEARCATLSGHLPSTLSSINTLALLLQKCMCSNL